MRLRHSRHTLPPFTAASVHCADRRRARRRGGLWKG